MSRIVLLLRFISFVSLLTFIVGAVHAAPQTIEYEQQILQFREYSLPAQVPKGYTLELLNSNLEQPRMLTFAEDDSGDLFIGSRSGYVYRLSPPYTQAEVLVRLDTYPHSIALREGEMLIARTDGLYRTPYQTGQKTIDSKDVSLLAALPGGRGHNTRTVRIGPDERIYTSLGITGNCSDEYIGKGYDFNDWRGGVMVLDESGEKPQWQPFATGLRNPVGFDWQPQTQIMYASNNGPDHWGYELPPEVFAKLTPDSFHGMPWFQYDGQQMLEDNCISGRSPKPISAVSIPATTFPARSAPMGVTFVTEGALGGDFDGDAVVAIHGSWATLPDGGGSGDYATRRPPKVVIVRFENNEAVRVDDLVTGFQLADGRRWGRPTGVAIGPDEALYFASDGGINGLFKLSKSKP